MRAFTVDIPNTLLLLGLVELSARQAREALTLKLAFENEARNVSNNLVLPQNGRINFDANGQPQASAAEVAQANAGQMERVFMDSLNRARQAAASLDVMLNRENKKAPE